MTLTQSQNAIKAALFNQSFNHLIMATIGTIILMPKSITLSDFTPCDGRQLDVSREGLLFAVFGTEFGGDGRTFNLPNLPDKFGFHHLICIKGNFSKGVNYNVDFDDDNWIGRIVPFDEDTIPNGWALCDGTTHPETDNPMLAKVLGAYSVVNKAGRFYDIPNTGSERYIICVKGEYPS
ncbi:MAG: tail fiber protein [Saprospiraceae bacterium]|nr:tail fiber protein [Saprospiraceae bacterium]